MNSDTLSKLAVATLDANKALDITNLDVRSLTNICDYMIICSATSRRHAASMADKLIRAMRDVGIRPFGTEGKTIGEWILVDFADIVVHIMLTETREFYNLEKLWSATQSIRDQQPTNDTD